MTEYELNLFLRSHGFKYDSLFDAYSSCTIPEVYIYHCDGKINMKTRYSEFIGYDSIEEMLKCVIEETARTIEFLENSKHIRFCFMNYFHRILEKARELDGVIILMEKCKQ